MKNKDIKKYLNKMVWIFPYNIEPKKGYLKKSDRKEFTYKLIYFTEYNKENIFYFNENMIFGIIEKA